MADAQQKFNIKNPVHFLALGFGSGLLNPAPGTWGTLAGGVLFLGVVHLVPPLTLVYFVLTITGFLVGCYLCGKAAEDVGTHDHSAIVWDEIIGLFVTLAWVPPNAANLVAGFVLFRLFDIVKPWPIKVLDQRVHGGLGIMVDDVAAGLMAALCLWLLQPWLMTLF